MEANLAKDIPVSGPDVVAVGGGAQRLVLYPSFSALLYSQFSLLGPAYLKEPIGSKRKKKIKKEG